MPAEFIRTYETVEGRTVIEVSCSDYSQFVIECTKWMNDCYTLKKASCKRKWPYFWIKEYKAQFTRPFICDIKSGVVAFVPDHIEI